MKHRPDGPRSYPPGLLLSSWDWLIDHRDPVLLGQARNLKPDDWERSPGLIRRHPEAVFFAVTGRGDNVTVAAAGVLVLAAASPADLLATPVTR